MELNRKFRFNSGQVIDRRYSVIEKVAEGGMGSIYAVKDLKLNGQIRALKVLHPDERIQPKLNMEEAQLLMKLRHPHLPVMFDYFPPNDDQPEMIIMEYIHGHTITELWQQNVLTGDLTEILEIVLQICTALIYLHEQPNAIIHRDLKPSNIMIDEYKQVKLIDFGISKTNHSNQIHQTIPYGTFGFSAPEQLQGLGTDVKSDIYSIGAILYYCLNKGKKWLSNDHYWNPEHMLRPLYAEYPKSLICFVEKLIQPNPLHRLATAREVYEHLTKLHASVQKKRESHSSSMKPFSSISNGHGSKWIGCVSFSKGAGASSLAAALALLLHMREVDVSAIEYYENEPSWKNQLPWLKSHSFDKKGQLYSYTSSDNRMDSPLWSYLQPTMESQMMSNDAYFEMMLKTSKKGISIIDFSSQWTSEEAKQWLKQCGTIIIIADPFVSHWHDSSIYELNHMLRASIDHEQDILWVANKDMKFKGRSEWLSIFPNQPNAIVPFINPEDLLNNQWKGNWSMGSDKMMRILHKSLASIVAHIMQKY